jgi:hypothetical protein
MSRRPLQLVSDNAQRPSFPIFDDFKVHPAKTHTNVVRQTMPNRPIRRAGNSIAKLFIASIIVRKYEDLTSKMKEAFLRLANNASSSRNTSAEMHAPVVTKTTATPKKRRLEDRSEYQTLTTEFTNSETNSQSFASATPARSCAAPTTPHRGAAHTPRQLDSGSRERTSGTTVTPGRRPLSDVTNTRRDSSSPAPPKSIDPLSERLHQVEESLKKLSVAGAKGTPRETTPTRGSGLATAPEVRAEAHGAAGHPQPTKHGDGAASLPTDRVSPAQPLFSGTGATLRAPVVVEAVVLQSAIQQATRSSIKTLLRGLRDTTTPASSPDAEWREALAAYRQDSARIDNAFLQQAIPTGQSPEERAVKVLEAVTQYHHTRSQLAPLSALGDQAGRANEVSPVALSQLSMLQDKMSSWRSKYGGGRTGPER